MGASGQQDRPSAFPDHQALFMPEIILHEARFRFHLQPFICRRNGMLHADTGKEGQFLINPVNAGLLFFPAASGTAIRTAF